MYVSLQTEKACMRTALELECCPRSLVWARGIWKMVCPVRAANMGQHEYLVGIKSAYL